MYTITIRANGYSVRDTRNNEVISYHQTFKAAKAAKAQLEANAK
jgi:hypothetical protein